MQKYPNVDGVVAISPSDAEHLAFLVAADPEEWQERMIYLEVGVQGFGLRPADGGAHRHYEVGIEHIAFEVEDFDEAKRTLEERGLEYIEAPDGLPFRQLWLLDPNAIDGVPMIAARITLWYRPDTMYCASATSASMSIPRTRSFRIVTMPAVSAGCTATLRSNAPVLVCKVPWSSGYKIASCE